MEYGTFYAVSVGPGDPELLTLQAVRCLERTDIIAVPVNPTGSTTAFDIAARAVDLSGKQILRLRTVMAKDTSALENAHREQAELIRPYLESGTDVAMLTLGDTTIYSGAAYVSELLKAQGFPVRLLPGVPSFCAAAAALGISLTEMDTPIHIYPASSVPAEQALAQHGTKVLMKSGRQLPAVIAALEECGQKANAKLAANCGMENELLCRDLSALRELPGYYTTIIVRENGSGGKR